MTYKNLSICQASILDLPFIEGSFDFVVCLGVIQHTPNPEETIERLVQQLKKGGIILIDHYAPNYPETKSRKILRKFLIKRNTKFSYTFISLLTWLIWPVHRFVWFLERKIKTSNRGGRIRKAWLKFSPIVDYHTLYKDLNSNLQYTWSKLDTHDTLTDVYKHLRSVDEIKETLQKLEMDIVFVKEGGNGIIAKAIKNR